MREGDTGGHGAGAARSSGLFPGQGGPVEDFKRGVDVIQLTFQNHNSEF